ncbi:MlaD family protein [Acidihalobacter ferrooxydans]|uniref:Mce/MlaD domain-containing protein n=1 Tax=Acidihalobacter ferrooxydans TaxID=1765967 RepID=A0A1P8UF43_9GAMM|nr:MlaD family protein [Acidihalobacter ferrooxydans]APZ42473.1 hypothetical protein BW247_04695 [Acidihalobacter ferrooxydans]
MEDRSHALIALAFLAIFGIGSIALFMWVSHGPKEDRYYDIVTTHSAGGVQPQAGVYFKGLQVGSVKSLNFDPQDPRKVIIHIAVYPKAYITHATYATFSFGGITGMSNVDLHVAANGDTTPLATSATHPARIPLRSGMLASLEKSGKLDMKRVGSILNRVNDLLNASNRKQVAQLLDNLNTASARLATLERQLQPTLKSLPQLSAQLKELLAATRRLETRAQQPLAAATTTARAVTRLSNSGTRTLSGINNLEPRINVLVGRLNRTITEVQQLTHELNSQPQSLVFGPSSRRPGPGEPGFHAPSTQ